MSPPRERPAHLPADAFWDDDAWALGPTGAGGKRVGDWTYWSAAGDLLCEERWGDATTRLTYRRFHPDGTIAQEGARDLVHDRWAGTMRWIRSPRSSPENAPFPKTAGDNVRTFEVDIDDSDGLVITERSFDAEGRPLTQQGAPLPPRPAGVSPLAFMTQDRWVLQRRTLDGTIFGEELIHDRHGALITRTYLDPPGQVRERESYSDGALWSTVQRTPEGHRLESNYRGEAGSEWRESATLHRGEHDQTLTHYDRSGAPCHCVRIVEDGLHTRRYQDDRLIFESIRPEDPNQPPIKVAYYELDGRPLIDYRSAGDGTGTWTLHPANGGPPLELPETDEASNNRNDRWSRFLPAFRRYDRHRPLTNPAHAREQFQAVLNELAAERRLNEQPLSPAIRRVLDAVDWDLQSARGLRDIARATREALADDDDIAAGAIDSLWFEIEHQGSVYEATYEVATVLAAVLPLLADKPVIERRLFDFLHQVLSIEGIVVADRQAYARLAAALARSTDLFHRWSRHPDDETALPAQHLLARATAGTPEGERHAHALIARATTPVRRAYAACVLWNVLPRRSRPAALTDRFTREPEPEVRFVVAMLMLYSGADHPQLADVIEAAMLDPEPFDIVFDELRPFFAGDVLEYLVGVLPPATLERHANRMIDALVAANPLSQIAYLHAVFQVLLPGGPPGRPTKIQRRALRAAADIAEAHDHAYGNHMEVFQAHDIPYDAAALRELADLPSRPAPARKRRIR